MYVLAAVVALRVFNPNDVAVDAALRCADETRLVRLESHELRDVDDCASAEAFVPLVALNTSFDGQREWQQVLDGDAECGVAPMAAPLFGCRNGVGSAYVAPVDGATYAWSAEGAVITAGGNTSRVLVQLGDAATATLTCVITTEECTKTATGVIAVREPIVVKSFTVPSAADANEPLTITWSYEPGHEPVTQMLTGDLFTQPVLLAPQQRSYTTTPQNGGTRGVELRASHARTIHVAPPPKTRRRSVGGGATATECPSALATARIDVRGCVPREPTVHAPFDVAAGATFEAEIRDLDDDDKVQWSVDNGTISYLSPFGTRVLVVAGTTGQTDVHARVERSAGCVANGSAAVAIIRPAAQCAIAPTAALTLVSAKCDGAGVRASFTGTPPFAGRWSDGTEFRTTANFANHEFRAPGTYGMTEFRDSSCFGAVSGSPSATLKPKVKIVGVEGCGGGEVTATFTGMPPFSGTWSDGQPFTTSSATLTRSVPDGTWSVQNLTDAACSTVKATSNSVTFAPLPRTSVYLVEPESACHNPYSYWGWFNVKTTGGKPPYVYEFTDGTITTTQYPNVSVHKTGEPYGKTYELKRATAAGCEAILDDRFATVYQRIPVTLDSPPGTYCSQTEITIAGIGALGPLGQVHPAAGALIIWQVSGTAKPTILSGQGTPAITLRGDRGDVVVSVSTYFPDSHCNAQRTIGFKLVDCAALSDSGTAVTSRSDGQ